MKGDDRTLLNRRGFVIGLAGATSVGSAGSPDPSTTLALGGGDVSDEIASNRVKHYVGDLSERPTAGTKGRVWEVFDPDGPQHGALFYDDGEAWQLMDRIAGRIEATEASVGTVDETDPEAVTNVDYVESNSGVDTLDPTEIEEAATAESNNSLALGRDAWAHTEKGALALGNEAEASGGYSVAIGSGDDGEAFEDPVVASDLASIAIGNESEASDRDTVALGFRAEASAGRAVSIGASSSGAGNGSVAVGDDAFSAESQSIAIGRNSIASESRSIALGGYSHSSSNGAISIGQQSGNDPGFEEEEPIHEDTVTIGKGASVESDEDVVWNSSSSVALGSGASLSDASRSIAIGSNDTADHGAHAQADDVIAIGTEAFADAPNAIAIGEGADTGGQTVVVMALGAGNLFELDDAGNLSISGELNENATL